MNGTTGLIPFQLGHLHHLVNYSLSCNGGIAMNKNRKHFHIIPSVMPILLSTSNTLHHRPYRLKVRRVWRNIDIDLFSIIGFTARGPAQVIFNVTVKNILFVIFSVKLAKNIFSTLTKDIGKRI